VDGETWMPSGSHSWSLLPSNATGSNAWLLRAPPCTGLASGSSASNSSGGSGGRSTVRNDRPRHQPYLRPDPCSDGGRTARPPHAPQFEFLFVVCLVPRGGFGFRLDVRVAKVQVVAIRVAEAQLAEVLVLVILPDRLGEPAPEIR
jgi:hypothetical protein